MASGTSRSSFEEQLAKLDEAEHTARPLNSTHVEYHSTYQCVQDKNASGNEHSAAV